MRPDVDMEIVTDEPRVEDGFAVVAGLAVCQAVGYDDVGSLEEFDRWRLRREGSRS